MLIPGLVSVTFRDSLPEQVANVAARAGLRTIEWGGDVHVPPDNLNRATYIRRVTIETGLTVAAYGTYFRLGRKMAPLPWVETAAALGAPTMRIWAGSRASAEIQETERSAIYTELRQVCELASRHGLTVSLEFHEDTLTDSADSTARLLREVAHPALRSYWQPLRAVATPAELQANLATVRPWLTHVHLFHREGATNRWLALTGGQSYWPDLLRSLAGRKNQHGVLIEFVRNHDLNAFGEDAAELLRWLAEIEPKAD